MSELNEADLIGRANPIQLKWAINLFRGKEIFPSPFAMAPIEQLEQCRFRFNQQDLSLKLQKVFIGNMRAA